ncbi:KOW domain-containing RNA-binding protein [Gudongella oleilytica]|jgi:ribosomal protein L14E/L6E/L27E|uniref:KOW domain-containing RNA-binding protein n=1 Tax=Gudongella oleilytica TaxID=1582259 RepID=UPI000FF878D8|nr:KOW domain-containing RNA-binding protein [Gudongella oleilytica]
MDSTADISIGQVVKSRAGRDKGRIFLVYGIADEQYVYIVDGDLRRLDSPKKKKIKHLIVFNTVLPEFKEKIENSVKINNSYIRKILEPFNKSF